jgi:YfiH family protein
MKDYIENNIWRSGILKNFEKEIAYGGLTKLFKETEDEFLKYIDPDAQIKDIVKTKREHTNTVLVIDEEFIKLSSEEKQMKTESVDGLITNLKHIPLYMRAADCASVALYDPVQKAAGLFHSGWRGTSKIISVIGLEKMKKIFGSKPEDIIVSIGPAIFKQDYEVDTVVYEKFSDKFSKQELSEVFEKAENKSRHYFLDIPKAIKIKLLEAGIKEKNIEISEYSTTRNNDIFPSARKAGGVANVDTSIYILSLL